MKKKKKKYQRSIRMSAKAREIIASLNEAIEAEQSGVPMGSRFTVRTVELPSSPYLHDSASVRATREIIGASQTIFAHLMGVSAVLVRAWEQGHRKPAMWACRLLDEMNRDPRHWQRMFRKAS